MNTSAFQLHLDDEGIATLTFDLPDSSANIFNARTLEELGQKIVELRGNSGLKGLIIRSAKPSIFIAGADLKALSQARDENLSVLIKQGQEVFNRLAALPIPTVAAIHGACAGGGFELALACDWRLASDSPKTRIGLPETQLGILPAWGGTTRLPRLIGLPKALAHILSGKLVPAAVARRKGLVDALVPTELLLEQAHAFLARGKRTPPRFPLLHNPLSVAFIRRRARMTIRKRTRGLYPGPLKALQVACEGLRTTFQASLDLEHDAIRELAPRSETRNLIRLFFLSESARKKHLPNHPPAPVKQVAVIGAGVMGSGIAYWLSARGIPVILQDISDEALAAGMQRITKLYQKAQARHVFTKTGMARALDRVVPMSGAIPLTRCDLIIEAATEDLAIKQKIFRDLAQRAGPHTVFATNTSALPIESLAQDFPAPERLLGLHFFNPVHQMRLIEVVRAKGTSDEALAQALGFVQQIGKLPVIVDDQPGFLVNRILMPYLMEAGNLFANGGDPVAIDRSMLDFGMPMGPLRLLDEIGLDVALHVAKTLGAAFPDRMGTPEILQEMTAKGILGRKTGKGFYLYDNRGPRPNPEALSLQGAVSGLPDDLGERLARTIVLESVACLRDGVVEGEDDLDLAMVLGTGFAPFRGGPIAYAHARGILRPPRTAEGSPVDLSDLNLSPQTS